MEIQFVRLPYRPPALCFDDLRLVHLKKRPTTAEVAFDHQELACCGELEAINDPNTARRTTRIFFLVELTYHREWGIERNDPNPPVKKSSSGQQPLLSTDPYNPGAKVQRWVTVGVRQTEFSLSPDGLGV